MIYSYQIKLNPASFMPSRPSYLALICSLCRSFIVLIVQFHFGEKLLVQLILAVFVGFLPLPQQSLSVIFLSILARNQNLLYNHYNSWRPLDMLLEVWDYRHHFVQFCWRWRLSPFAEKSSNREENQYYWKRKVKVNNMIIHE